MTDAPDTANTPATTQTQPSNSAPFTANETIVDLLRQTKPWVRFLSIMGFIGVPAVGLLGVGSFWEWSQSEERILLIMAIGYCVFAIGSYRVAFCLHQYANSISEFVFRKGSDCDIERALEHHRAYWKSAGILVIVMLCLFVVFIILNFIIAIDAVGGAF